MLTLTRPEYPMRKEAGGLTDAEECSGQLRRAASKKSNDTLGKIVIWT
jgi:hypothetical protein